MGLGLAFENELQTSLRLEGPQEDSGGRRLLDERLAENPRSGVGFIFIPRRRPEL